MKQDIKKLIISAVILSVGFFSIDNLVGYIGELALKKLPDFGNELCKTNYRLNRVKTDIIIVGSSRASHHYHSAILIDSINNYLCKNYTLYNVGIGGQFVDCNACTVESILNRYKPKLIIFDTNEQSFNEKSNWRKHLRRYEPFYKNNIAVKDYLDRMGIKEKIRARINMCRYNSKSIFILGGLRHRGVPNNGYEPLYNVMKSTTSNNKKTTKGNGKNDFSIYSFNKMLALCKELNTKILIVSSPRYKPTNNNDMIQSICNKFDTPYIEIYNTDYYNNHPELFYDKNHLNNEGAIIYTQMFFEELKPYLIGL